MSFTGAQMIQLGNSRKASSSSAQSSTRSARPTDEPSKPKSSEAQRWLGGFFPSTSASSTDGSKATTTTRGEGARVSENRGEKDKEKDEKHPYREFLLGTL